MVCFAKNIIGVYIITLISMRQGNVADSVSYTKVQEMFGTKFYTTKMLQNNHWL